MKPKELIVASGLFLIIILVFFYKIFFGLIPLPTDLIVGGYYPWLNYVKQENGLGIPYKNPKLSDAVSIVYPLKSLAATDIKNEEFPLWNPYMFSGFPLFTSPILALFFPTMIFYILFSSPLAWTLQTMSQPFLSSVFMYIFLRHLKLKKLPSFYGGIVYGFGGFSIICLQWNSISTSSMLLPILLFSLDKYLLTKNKKWGLALSVFIALLILSGYLPVIWMTFVAMLIWYLYFKKQKLINLNLLKYGLLGLGLSAFFWLPLLELIKNSQRISETLSVDSPFIAFRNLIMFLAPDFFGNAATNNFWGRGDQLDFTLYVGISTIVLALTAVSKINKNIYLKFAIYLFIFTLLISTPNPISQLLYRLKIWGGSSIAMNRANFISNFSLSVLASFGLSFVMKKSSKLSIKPAFLVLTTLAIIAATLLIIKSHQEGAYLIHTNVALRNLILPTALAFGVFLVFTFIKKIKISANLIGYIFIIILIADLFRFGWKFNAFSKLDYLYPDTPISTFLKKYPNDRVVFEKDIFPANMWQSYKLSSIEGYESLYPVGSAKILAVANSGIVTATPQTRWGILSNFSSKLLDISNVKFFVALKNHIVPEKYQEVFEDKDIVIYENTQSLPRAFLVNQVIRKTDDESLSLLISDEFDPQKTAVTTDFEFYPNSELQLKYTAEYKQLNNSHIQINTSANLDAFLVVADSYYPGWKAYIDNKESAIYKTNYNFRGVFLKKGDHTVDFIYSPNSFKYGLLISGLSVIIVLIIIKRK